MAFNFEEIATQFVDHYYNTFDGVRSSLSGLYRENSMLTFESSQSLGASAITEKLTSLPFQKVQHKKDTVDAQPTATGGIVILVTGQLLVDEEANPLRFSQVFQLCQDAQGQWFVFNDIFKLVLG